MSDNYPRYLINMNLTHFLGAYIKEMENEGGNIEKYVCIPMNRNNINVFKSDAYVNLTMNEKNTAMDNGWTHSISVYMPKDVIEKLSLMGYKPPFIGKAKAYQRTKR